MSEEGKCGIFLDLEGKYVLMDRLVFEAKRHVTLVDLCKEMTKWVVFLALFTFFAVSSANINERYNIERTHRIYFGHKPFPALAPVANATEPTRTMVFNEISNMVRAGCVWYMGRGSGFGGGRGCTWGEKGLWARGRGSARGPRARGRRGGGAGGTGLYWVVRRINAWLPFHRFPLLPLTRFAECYCHRNCLWAFYRSHPNPSRLPVRCFRPDPTIPFYTMQN